MRNSSNGTHSPENSTKRWHTARRLPVKGQVAASTPVEKEAECCSRRAARWGAARVKKKVRSDGAVVLLLLVDRQKALLHAVADHLLYEL